MPTDPLTIWIFSDAKPGHVNQTRALAEGVGRRRPIDLREIDATRASRFTGRVRAEFTRGVPPPDLILCAGRRTHRAARAAAHRFRAALVCCMRPPSRASAYDLCLIPRHDDPPSRANIEPTVGAIVNVRPSFNHDAAKGVILIGGASKHCAVDDAALLNAVTGIATRTPHIAWDLTTSRRTPEMLRDALVALRFDNLTVTPADRTPQGWVGERLAAAGSAWVTEDSVSMLCEAITSGCATGVLPMERISADSRVLRCVDAFTGSLSLATRFDRWQNGAELAPPQEALDEADRCAQLILDRFFTGTETAP